MAKTELSLEILDLPYDILFEIFRRLRRDKLLKISRLCLQFRDVAGDPRFWKHAKLKYDSTIFAFEELYSEPWPVEEIQLRHAEIKRPVSSKIGRVVKVKKLDLTSITVSKSTFKAILAKYQCKELYLDYHFVDRKGRIQVIAPEAFAKQTALEVLGLDYFVRANFGSENGTMNKLAQGLSNCKNLKTLYLNTSWLTDVDFLVIVKNLPKSLEKLFLGHARREDLFFELLAESVPNLRELQCCPVNVSCPFLLKFQFLEALHIFPWGYNDEICDLYIYDLIKLPALKTVYYIDSDPIANFQTNFVKLSKALEPHDIIVRLSSGVYPPYPKGCKSWKVSRAIY